RSCVVFYLFIFSSGVIPDESKAMSLLAPANAVAGMMPGGGLLPTPNPLASIGATPFGGLGAPSMDQIAAMGIAGPNMSPHAFSADFLKLMQSIDPKLNPLAAGLNLAPGLKPDSSNKEIEEAMKRVREAQSLISAAIEPGSKKDDKRKHSRSPSRSRRKRSRSRSKHKRSNSRSRQSSHSRSRRRSKSPRRRRTRSRDRSRRSRSRDRRKEEKSKKKSKTPPKSYSSARRSRSISRQASSCVVTRDYDEEEQGYDSDKAGEEEDDRRSESDSVSSPKDQEDMERDERQTSKRSKLNGDDRHQEDMEMSD
uniref:Serine and arginine rich splicing factor 11 n=1 Tax=Xiphophorus couchianus TaxID=32473 RepID=A0A3B5KVE2_9TELE